MSATPHEDGPKITREQLFHHLEHDYYSVLDSRTKIEPWDIYVKVYIPALPEGENDESEEVEEETDPLIISTIDDPEEGEKPKAKRGMKKGQGLRQYIVDLTNFFARYPELTWSIITFLEPTRREKANKEIVLNDLIAWFANPRFKTEMEIPRNKKSNSVVAARSRLHAIQLLEMFKHAVPTEKGELAELFIKLTPLLPDTDKESKRVWKMTLFTPLEEEVKKVKPATKVKAPKIATAKSKVRK